MTCRHLAATAALALLAACGRGGGELVGDDIPLLLLDPASVVAVPGDTVRLRVLDGRGRPYPLTSFSIVGTAATVDLAGLVTALAPGTAVVTITLTAHGQTVTGSVPVTVLGITVMPGAMTLQTGATQQLEAMVTLRPDAPAGTSRGVLYASSDTTVATVSPTGLVTGRRNGTAAITVAMAASPTTTRTVPVTVRGGVLQATFQSITTGDPPVSIDPAAVRGRIRVTVNVRDAEGYGTLRLAELWLAGRRAVALDGIAFVRDGVTPVTMEIDTAARDPQPNARLYPNGAALLEFRLEFAPPGATTGQGVIVQLPLTLANP